MSHQIVLSQLVGHGSDQSGLAMSGVSSSGGGPSAVLFGSKDKPAVLAVNAVARWQWHSKPGLVSTKKAPTRSA